MFQKIFQRRGQYFLGVQKIIDGFFAFGVLKEIAFNIQGQIVKFMHYAWRDRLIFKHRINGYPRFLHSTTFEFTDLWFKLVDGEFTWGDSEFDGN